MYPLFHRSIEMARGTKNLPWKNPTRKDARKIKTDQRTAIAKESYVIPRRTRQRITRTQWPSFLSLISWNIWDTWNIEREFSFTRKKKFLGIFRAISYVFGNSKSKHFILRFLFCSIYKLSCIDVSNRSSEL